MNAALQTICSIPELASFVTNEALVRRDLNTTSKFGMKGLVAQVYADFATTMAKASASYPMLTQEGTRGIKCGTVAPQYLKMIMGYYKQRYQGYNQADSGEFLSFLLDGLHEDLNRITDKEYMEDVDTDDDAPMDRDSVQARFEEKRRLKYQNEGRRENSHVSEICGGAVRSTIKCRTCGRESSSYEMHTKFVQTLDLPPPRVSDTLRFTVFFARAGGARPLRLAISCARADRAAVLAREIAAVASKAPIWGRHALARSLTEGG